MKTIKFDVGGGMMVDIPSFCGLPIVYRDGKEVNLGTPMLILTNWEGNACKIVTSKAIHPGSERSVLEAAYDKHPEWFEPCDKGGLAVYGTDQFGNVKYGCCVYGVHGNGDPMAKNPLERGKHLYVSACQHVSGFVV